MIVVTRLNGQAFALNADLIERIEASPDTTITLVDGTKYLVQDTIDDVIDRIRLFRASLVALANQIQVAPPETDPAGVRHLHAVPQLDNKD